MAQQADNQQPVALFLTNQKESAPYPSHWWIAWQRRSLILLGAVVGLAVGALYYSQQTPIYRSTAQVYVIKKVPQFFSGNAQEKGGQQATEEDYLSSHLILIKSPANIHKAVQRPEVQELKSLAGKADPTDMVIRSLTVTREKDSSGALTNILNLSYQGTDPGDCKVILGAVIDSYNEFLDETYRRGSGDTLKLISQAKDVMQNQLSAKEAEYKAFREKSPLVVGWKGKEGSYNPQQERLASIESQRVTLEVRRAEVQGRLTAIETALKAGENGTALLAMIADQARRNSGRDSGTRGNTMSLEDQLFPLMVEEQNLLQQYGPDHPQVQAVRKRIEFTRNLFSHPGAITGTDENGGQKSGAELREVVEAYAKSLRQELNDIDVSEKALTDLYGKENDEAKKMTDFEVQNDTYQRDIAGLQKLYESIIDRLQQVSLVKDVEAYDAKTISPPTLGVKVEPKPTLIFPMALFLGLLVGFGLAYLAYVSDHSFRNPEEIRTRLGVPVVGHVPFLAWDQKKLEEVKAAGVPFRSILWAYFWPRSAEAEAFRGVRTALYFSAEGDHKVIQITSPNKGDGKSTVSTNLAVSIAQSGKKILLIDADFRRPRLHRIFGLPGKVGLASVIAGTAELQDAIQQTPIPNLSVLPCGPIPPNPAELLTQPAFKELIDLLREQYDFVILDTPPLLAVTDPSVVVPRVDGVLLVIRITKNGRPDVERARDVLATLEATVLGVVVNGAGGPQGYGYKHYQYDTKYQYGYYRYTQDTAAEGQDQEEDAEDADGSGNGAGAGQAPAEHASDGGHARSRPGLLRRIFSGG